MRLAGRYCTGVGVIAAGAVAASLALSTADRRAVWLALGATMLLQAPLGWWLVNVVRRGGSALTPWVVGMLLRLSIIGAMGLVVLPRAGLPVGVGLVGLVILLVLLVAVEGLVLWWEHFRSGEP